MSYEVWKDVVGYEGLYQISNLGRVKSMEKNLEFQMLVTIKFAFARTISKNS